MSTSASTLRGRNTNEASFTSALYSFVSLLLAPRWREAFAAATNTDPADARWTWGM